MDNTIKRINKVKKRRNENSCLAENGYEKCVSNSKKYSTELNHSVSIQMLKKIAEKKSVMVFDIEKREYYLNEGMLQRKNIKKANVYRALCGFHDIKLFSAIENGNEYNIGNGEQEFQFAYRAFVFSYSQSIIKDGFDLSHPLYERIGKKNLIKNHSINKRFINGYNNKLWNEITSTVVELDYEVAFVSSFCSKPVTTLSRRNMVGNEDIFFSVFPENGKTYIVLSYFRDSNNRVYKYCHKVKDCAINNPLRFKKYLSKLVISTDHNLALAPSLWEEFSNIEKKEFYYYSQLLRKDNTDIIQTLFKILRINFRICRINLFIKRQVKE